MISLHHVVIPKEIEEKSNFRKIVNSRYPFLSLSLNFELVTTIDFRGVHDRFTTRCLKTYPELKARHSKHAHMFWYACSVSEVYSSLVIQYAATMARLGAGAHHEVGDERLRDSGSWLLKGRRQMAWGITLIREGGSVSVYNVCIHSYMYIYIYMIYTHILVYVYYSVYNVHDK